MNKRTQDAQAFCDWYNSSKELDEMHETGDYDGVALFAWNAALKYRDSQNKSAYVHLPKDPDRFIALHPGDRLTIEARNPDPAVVQQLVEALSGLIDFIEIDNLKIDQDALRIARASLATAKEAGL